MKSEKAAEFRRGLGTLDSTMIVIGSMIGSGIFIVSADIARSLGSPALLLAVWIVTGFITLIAALSYGELAGMMPHAGGQYIYLKEAYNPMLGFLYGWTSFLVIQTGTIAAVAVAFAKFTGVLIPFFSEKHILLQLGGFSISAAQILAVASIALLTSINSRGLQQGKRIQNLFTFAKVAGVLALIAFGIFLGMNTQAISANWSAGFWTNHRVTTESLPLLFGAAMVGSLFSSDAWNNITFTAAEVRDPKRTIPISLAIGTIVVTIIYLLANLAYLVVLPLAGTPEALDVVGRGIQFAQSDRVGTAVANVAFGNYGERFMAILIMISTFGCNNGLILSGARIYRTMAVDGLFFKSASELNANGVPAKAALAQGIWASLLCLSGTYGDLLDYVIFAVLVFYILTVYGIFILRKKRPKAERPYRAFGYPILPGLYLLIASLICLDLLIMKPRFTFPGLLIVLSGIPVYGFWKAKQK